jgi:DeoR/GlpR family transcriptional regulator of sugar metabolism
MVHDYGPGRQIVSFHAEVPSDSDINIAHEEVDQMERDMHEKFGCIVTVHLDPIVTDDPLVNEMREIAEKAASIIEPGTGIFIDSGTTAMALAKLLPDVNLVVVTPAPSLALEVMSHKQLPSVVLLGGTLSRHSLSVSDPEAWRQLDLLNIDTAFVAASGFDKKTGFSVGSQLESILKRSVISRARRVVILADSSKLGAMLPFSFAAHESSPGTDTPSARY